jgi:hypothetical protein
MVCTWLTGATALYMQPVHKAGSTSCFGDVGAAWAGATCQWWGHYKDSYPPLLHTHKRMHTRHARMRALVLH